MSEQAPALWVQLTPEQVSALIQIMHAINIQGRHAAMVVSIQVALANAQEAPGATVGAPQG